MTSDARPILEDIISDFALEKFSRFFREKSRQFADRQEDLTHYNDADFAAGAKQGEIKFPDGDELIVCTFKVRQPLSERSGKKAQYEKAKKILKEKQISAGIFIFCDAGGNFRFSLVYPESMGAKRQWNNFRRFTYFVSGEFTNKTFLNRIGDGDFSSLQKVKEAFAIGPVTDLFYKEFFVEYDKLVKTVQKTNNINESKARDFVLLLAIRTIFLGFIQKRKWLGNDEKFIQSFFRAYQKTEGANTFYKDWLSILFFEALNKKFFPRKHLPKEMNNALQLAPYLNGGLFKEKKDYDEQGWLIPDKEIADFFDFLFSHSFTIEESSLDDAELQLNPEFLGIIFERLVNKADGAVYTPRTEVDLMCRLSLVKWLMKNLELPITKANLYELFFREGAVEEDQKEGSFSPKEAREILAKLESLAICDLGVGSGAFLVGMMQVLDEIEQNLKERYGLASQNVFERKKRIIAQSLYGVEVKEWAVWICQLRLWLSLFVEAPEEMRYLPSPILPSLDFKIRQGDSLVQRVGSKAFPVLGHAAVGKTVKDKVTKLKNLKVEYFENKTALKDWEIKQRELAIYDEILQTEIREKQDYISALRGSKQHEQTTIDAVGCTPGQANINFDKEKIELLTSEIKELLEQKQNIRNDKPLIWNIEFAEIFVEKDGFDITIGNPPYVQKEDIADPLGKIKDKKEYKNYLQEMVRLDFPDDFPLKKKINAQSDLYTYFYIRALRLLNPKGIHTFICSNSWLDVGYGAWLQEFLLQRCQVELIIDNHAKRSFEAADVNTIISVIHAPQKKVDQNHPVKFVAFKMPFEEAIFTENLLAIEDAGAVVSNDVFRVYPITVKDLQEAGMEYEHEGERKLDAGKYIGDKWGGKYLRAPDFFIKLIRTNRNIIKLSEVCKVDGYVHDNNTGNGFPKTHFIKSVKNTRIIHLKKSHEGVIKYGVKNEGNSRVKSSILMARTYGRDHLVIFNPEGIVGKEFYKIIPNKEEQTKTLAAFANSTFFILERELFGLTNLGGGGLKFSGDDIGMFFLPCELAISDDVLLDSFFSREIKSIFDECGIDVQSKIPIEEQEPKPLPDRAELDKIVFDALNLTSDERKEVYRAVCRLVWNRISKAKSV